MAEIHSIQGISLETKQLSYNDMINNIKDYKSHTFHIPLSNVLQADSTISINLSNETGCWNINGLHVLFDPIDVHHDNELNDQNVIQEMVYDNAEYSMVFNGTTLINGKLAYNQNIIPNNLVLPLENMINLHVWLDIKLKPNIWYIQDHLSLTLVWSEPIFKKKFRQMLYNNVIMELPFDKCQLYVSNNNLAIIDKTDDNQSEIKPKQLLISPRDRLCNHLKSNGGYDVIKQLGDDFKWKNRTCIMMNQFKDHTDVPIYALVCGYDISGVLDKRVKLTTKCCEYVDNRLIIKHTIHKACDAFYSLKVISKYELEGLELDIVQRLDPFHCEFTDYFKHTISKYDDKQKTWIYSRNDDENTMDNQVSLVGYMWGVYLFITFNVKDNQHIGEYAKKVMDGLELEYTELYYDTNDRRCLAMREPLKEFPDKTE
jgi:hypothetical protein